MRKTVQSGLLALAFCATFCATGAEAQESAAIASDLKRLSIEELMEIDVTSVSRRSERMSQAAAAVTVVTQADIRRSGVNSLPEALRLINALQVARQTQGSYAISTRGFNATAANKMLVLIDGRSIYTPLFSGVFWDVQDTLLEDIDRIEVIRGPGAALWGANAVNGVINIVTRRAEDTQGGLVAVGGGQEEEGFAAVRYGGRLAGGAYRAYGRYVTRDPLVFAAGGGASDHLWRSQGGFRADWGSREEGFTLQGDAYTGRTGDPLRDDTNVDGGNLTGRWSRSLSEGSALDVQVYYDRTHRHTPNFFEEHRDTADLSLQHRRRQGRHDLVWGGGYRFTRDEVGNSAGVGFFPQERSQSLFEAFVQDEVRLLAERLRLTAGVKMEHNESTGLEVQPSVRFAWVPDERRTLWGAVSRAVRTPTRLDEDVVFFNAQGQSTIRGSRDFESEELLAWELGYRVQASPELLLDAAAFYHQYDDLRSQEPTPGTGLPIVLRNKLEGETYGVEMRSFYDPLPGWQLQLAYAYLGKELRLDPDSRDATLGRAEGNDPRHRLQLRSSFDLPRDFELDGWLRYVDELPFPRVEAYTELNLRLGWMASERLELSLVGQNLLHESHAEFGPATILREEVERAVYGKAVWRF